MVVFIYIISAVILLGLCIFVHELGHLLGGKMVGIKAEVFSLGYGKGFIKKKFGDTTYQLTFIPFGGYCQFYGENPSEERSGEEYEFLSAHPLKRIVTVVMGPLFNLFFGIIIFFVMNMVGYSKDTNRVYIPEQYRSGKYISAAYKANIRSGDRIVRIDDKNISSFSDIQSSVFFSDGKRLKVGIVRDGKSLNFTVTPKKYNKGGRHEIGVVPYGSRILVVDLIDGGAAMEKGLKRMDEIVSLDGIEMKNETDFVKYINSHGNREIKFKILRSGKEIDMVIAPRLSDIIKIQAVGKTGMRGEPLTINKSKKLMKYIEKGKVKINDKRVVSYDELIKSIEKNRGRRIAFKIDNEKYSGFAKVERVGLIGIYPAIAPDKMEIKYSVGEAFINSFVEPYEFIVMNLKGIGMLFSGKMNVRENLSGPIRIAKIAGDVAYYKGISEFIILMAKISIILMVMNLLPIPVVDGGHLIFFLIEIIRGKPMSQKIMERIQTAGIIILIMLGTFVIINDISMLPIIQNLFN